MANKGIKQNPISVELKKEVYKEFKNGKSIRHLSKTYGIPHQSIFTFISKYRKDKTVELLKRKGRPKSSYLSELERLRMENEILKNFQVFLKEQQEKR